MIALAFIDTETTSLDAGTGEIWEVALIVRQDGATSTTERSWLLPVELRAADPISLDIGRFHERHPQGNAYRAPVEFRDLASDLATFAREFASLTHDAHLVGNVVSFDEERLRKLLRAAGVMPSWHYHLVDVEALVAGKLGLAPPWDSRALSEAIGVEMPSDEERHTAMGDALWAMRLYDAVIGGER